MLRTVAMTAFVFGLTASLAQADFLVGVEDLSSTTINSGDSFTFAIRLSGAQDLAAYTIPIFIEGSSGTPGVDFSFSPLPDLPTTDYVFGSTPTGNFGVTTDTSISGFPQRERLTLFDNLNSGSVQTGPGNDLVALVSVATSASFSGTINLFFDNSGLELLDSNLDPITNGTTSPSSSATAIQINVRSVPEPIGLSFLGVTLISGYALRKRKRCRA